MPFTIITTFRVCKGKPSPRNVNISSEGNDRFIEHVRTSADCWVADRYFDNKTKLERTRLKRRLDMESRYITGSVNVRRTMSYWLLYMIILGIVSSEDVSLNLRRRAHQKSLYFRHNSNELEKDFSNPSQNKPRSRLSVNIPIPSMEGLLSKERSTLFTESNTSSPNPKMQGDPATLFSNLGTEPKKSIVFTSSDPNTPIKPEIRFPKTSPSNPSSSEDSYKPLPDFHETPPSQSISTKNSPFGSDPLTVPINPSSFINSTTKTHSRIDINENNNYHELTVLDSVTSTVLNTPSARQSISYSYKRRESIKHSTQTAENPPIISTSFHSEPLTEIPSHSNDDIPIIQPTVSASFIQSWHLEQFKSSRSKEESSNEPNVLQNKAPLSKPSHINNSVPSLVTSNFPSTFSSSFQNEMSMSRKALSQTISTVPTQALLEKSSNSPSDILNEFPTRMHLTFLPTKIPTTSPRVIKSEDRTQVPSPIQSSQPTLLPSPSHTPFPSNTPTKLYTDVPSSATTEYPSASLSQGAPLDPTPHPNLKPTYIPSEIPSSSSSLNPSLVPSSNSKTTSLSPIPSNAPTKVYTDVPSFTRTEFFSASPSRGPSVDPTVYQSLKPTSVQSKIPSNFSSLNPSLAPSSNSKTTLLTPIPSNTATKVYMDVPSTTPTGNPSASPSQGAPSDPTSHPSLKPTYIPSEIPSDSTSLNPSLVPSSNSRSTPLTPILSNAPTKVYTDVPSSATTEFFSASPSQGAPSDTTVYSSLEPTYVPSEITSDSPSLNPSLAPSSNSKTTLLTPIPSNAPTKLYTDVPSSTPTEYPSASPSQGPSVDPTVYPSYEPTYVPSKIPSSFPSLNPSLTPSLKPTLLTPIPSNAPTKLNTDVPSSTPTGNPSASPSQGPSFDPTVYPSLEPTYIPSEIPSSFPSLDPSLPPSSKPTQYPSASPSLSPTKLPSDVPTTPPTFFPSSRPSNIPTNTPSISPSLIPSLVPSVGPTSIPSRNPSMSPTHLPTLKPSLYPTSKPSVRCHDRASYRSPINGLTCAHHKNTNCLMWKYIGLNETEIADLVESCPISCNIPCGSYSYTHSISPSSSVSASPSFIWIELEYYYDIYINNVQGRMSENDMRIFEKIAFENVAMSFSEYFDRDHVMLKSLDIISQELVHSEDRLLENREKSLVVPENNYSRFLADSIKSRIRISVSISKTGPAEDEVQKRVSMTFTSLSFRIELGSEEFFYEASISLENPGLPKNEEDSGTNQSSAPTTSTAAIVSSVVVVLCFSLAVGALYYRRGGVEAFKKMSTKYFPRESMHSDRSDREQMKNNVSYSFEDTPAPCLASPEQSILSRFRRSRSRDSTGSSSPLSTPGLKTTGIEKNSLQMDENEIPPMIVIDNIDDDMPSICTQKISSTKDSVVESETVVDNSKDADEESRGILVKRIEASSALVAALSVRESHNQMPTYKLLCPIKSNDEDSAGVISPRSLISSRPSIVDTESVASTHARPELDELNEGKPHAKKRERVFSVDTENEMETEDDFNILFEKEFKNSGDKVEGKKLFRSILGRGLFSRPKDDSFDKKLAFDDDRSPEQSHYESDGELSVSSEMIRERDRRLDNSIHPPSSPHQMIDDPNFSKRKTDSNWSTIRDENIDIEGRNEVQFNGVTNLHSISNSSMKIDESSNISTNGDSSHNSLHKVEIVAVQSSKSGSRSVTSRNESPTYSDDCALRHTRNGSEGSSSIHHHRSTSDDQTLGGYRYTFLAPSNGKLGLIIESKSTENIGPTIFTVKDYSPLFGMVQSGDKIIAVDGEHTLHMSTGQITNLFSSKRSKNPGKKGILITVMSKFEKEGIQPDIEPFENFTNVKETEYFLSETISGNEKDECNESMEEAPQTFHLLGAIASDDDERGMNFHLMAGGSSDDDSMME